MSLRLFLAVIAAVILDAARTARDRYRDEAIGGLEFAPFPGCIRVSRDQAGGELPLPVRVPGAALDWEGHAAAPVDGEPLSDHEERALEGIAEASASAERETS